MDPCHLQSLCSYRYKLFFIVFSIIIITAGKSQAQTTIKGSIVDSETGAPLPYAHVVKMSTYTGTVTNEEGIFTFNCSDDDTLLVSYIGYEKRKIPCSYFLSHSKLHLTQIENQLGAIVVHADNNYLYDLFEAARINLSKGNTSESKAYFSLETTSRNLPIELLECYYNAKTNPTGISELKLKNGRIGLADNAGGYFLSLNTTDIISGYNLLQKGMNQFPANPLQFSLTKLKKHFNLTLKSIQDQVYKVQFSPVKDSTGNFYGYAWIDKESECLIKINLFQKDLKRHPITAIDPSHAVNSLNFDITYIFSNNKQQQLQQIDFQYELVYHNTLRTDRVQSRGVFLFYDDENTFSLPYFSAENSFVTDYEKIVAQPYNEQFWQHNKFLYPTKKIEDYRKFFRKNGILVNFDELSKQSPFLKNKVKIWNSDRLSLAQINEIMPSDIKRLIEESVVLARAQLYNFSYRIFVDENIIDDSTYFIVKTIINLEKSYYALEQKENTACFINIFFDLVEIEKRKMHGILTRQAWSDHQTDSICASSISRLETDLDRYLKTIDHGNNREALQSYIKLVADSLGIDNSTLISRE